MSKTWLYLLYYSVLIVLCLQFLYLSVHIEMTLVLEKDKLWLSFLNRFTNLLVLLLFWE